MKGQRVVRIMLLGLVIGFAGCIERERTRIAIDSDTKEEGTGMSSRDFRSVSQRMARSLISIAPIQNAKNPPTIAFLEVKNLSNDPYLIGDMFLNKMRTELIKHSEGKITFLDRENLQDIRKENREKERGKLTSSGTETPYGADYFLTGTIESIDRVAGSGGTTYMRYSFRLTHGSNSAIVWEDDYEIKKYSKAGIMDQ
jgi:PBP1b-binding outer membrane lipoprotein LpoB